MCASERAPEGPAAALRRDSGSTAVNTTFLLKRGCWAKPACHLPGPAQPAVAVRFCPVLFQNRAPLSVAPPAPPTPGLPTEPAPAGGAASAARAAAGSAAEGSASASLASAFALPYRVVFAVATLDSVFVYDTGEAAPLAVVTGALHCAAITDLAWSPDGQSIAVSSYDGYCSIIAFDTGDLGTPFPADQLPPHVAACSPAAAAAAAAARAAEAALRSAAAAAVASSRPETATLDAGAAPAAASAAVASATQTAAAPGASAPQRRIAPQAVSAPAAAGAAPAAAGPRRIAPMMVVMPAAAAPHEAARAAVRSAVEIGPGLVPHELPWHCSRHSLPAFCWIPLARPHVHCQPLRMCHLGADGAACMASAAGAGQRRGRAECR